ncbi:MAG: hypothetical protein JWP88_918 [Flaviaesturariibacter sp.]|nr:hypothetical protein [Flaviaesturariibacter sp.]
MTKLILFASLLATSTACFSQNAYRDSLTKFIANYVEHHEIIKGSDKKNLTFYPVNENFSVIATVEKTPNSSWFKMETSGLMRPLYRIFGFARFKIGNDSASLAILQSQSLLLNEQYKNLLFIPFTDLSSGQETYAGGRYLDFSIEDIINNQLRIDFNKAYNPYCAYVSNKYNCPIPPKENHLLLKIEAGEKAFTSGH